MALYKKVLEKVKATFDSLIKDDKSNSPYKEKMQRAIDFMSSCLDFTNDLDKYSAEEKNVKAASAVAIDGFIHDLNGSLMHYYMPDDSLEDWLKDMSVKDFAGIAEKVPGIMMYAVHTHRHGYFIAKITRMDRTVILVVMERDNLLFFNSDQIEAYTKPTDPRIPLARFAVNFIYYLKCFPEALTEGAPSDMPKAQAKDVRKSGGKSLTLGTSDKVKTKDERGIITAYYRRSYFRHYPENSAWYKAARGKVVLIDATVCKGHAKTVNKVI